MSTPKLWVPPKVDKEPQFFCRICKHQFLTDAVFVRHVLECSRANEAEIEAQRERAKGAADRFYGEGPDPEWAAYNAELERQGINPEEQYNRGRRSNIRRASES